MRKNNHYAATAGSVLLFLSDQLTAREPKMNRSAAFRLLPAPLRRRTWKRPEGRAPTKRLRERVKAGVIAQILAFVILAPTARAQFGPSRALTLPEDRFKSGTATLRAFIPVAEATRDSIVKLNLDGKTVALGAIIGTNGLLVTKASEIKSGKLTCKLANGTETDAKLIGIDEDNDVALVKADSATLPAIEWAAEETYVGQWAVTPGLETAPEAVGIISVPPRKIFPPRAYLGVILTNSAPAQITEIMPGLGAERAGLKSGDVILAVNEDSVTTREELTNKLRHFRDGQKVTLRVRREADELEFTVTMTVPKPERPRRGFDRQERMNRLGGELSQRAEGFERAIQHDTVLQPWQCGGPLVNLEGKAVGLNIARAGRVASYALPTELVKHIIDTLKTQAQTAVKHDPAHGTSQSVPPEKQ